MGKFPTFVFIACAYSQEGYFVSTCGPPLHLELWQGALQLKARRFLPLSQLQALDPLNSGNLETGE